MIFFYKKLLEFRLLMKFLDVVKTPLLTLPLLFLICSFIVFDFNNPCFMNSIDESLKIGLCVVKFEFAAVSVRTKVFDLGNCGESEKTLFFSIKSWFDDELFVLWRFLMFSFRFLFSSMKFFSIFSLVSMAISLNWMRYLYDSIAFKEVDSSNCSFLKWGWQFLHIFPFSVKSGFLWKNNKILMRKTNDLLHLKWKRIENFGNYQGGFIFSVVEEGIATCGWHRNFLRIYNCAVILIKKWKNITI